MLLFLRPDLERMFRAGEAASADFRRIVFRRLGDHSREVGEMLDEARLEIVEQAEHVVRNQNLAVAGGRGADTDGGGRYRAGNLAGEWLDRSLDDDGEGAGLVDGAGIPPDLVGFLVAMALGAIAAG